MACAVHGMDSERGQAVRGIRARGHAGRLCACVNWSAGRKCLNFEVHGQHSYGTAAMTTIKI